jgi:hypothetical protein
VGLQETFRAYPLAPGGYRTYLYTMENAGVRWVTEAITETVEAAWLEGDSVVVMSRLDALPYTSPRNGGYHSSEGATKRYRFISEGLIRDAREIPDYFSAAAKAVREPFGGDGIALEMYVGLFPEHLGATSVITGPLTVATRAGTFDSCWELATTGGATWGSVRWFCPGVGVVHYGFGDCAIGHCSTATADLIDYHIAELPEG